MTPLTPDHRLVRRSLRIRGLALLISLSLGLDPLLASPLSFPSARPSLGSFSSQLGIQALSESGVAARWETIPGASQGSLERRLIRAAAGLLRPRQSLRSRLYFLAKTGGLAGIVAVQSLLLLAPLAASAQILPDDQERARRWHEASQRRQATAELLQRAQGNLPLRTELLRWRVSEGMLAARGDPAAEAALRNLDEGLLILPKIADTLREMIISDPDENVRAKALDLIVRWLARTPALTSSVVTDDFQSALFTALEHPALIDSSLAVLSHAAGVSKEGFFSILSQLLIAREQAKLRSDLSSGARMDLALDQPPFGKFEPLRSLLANLQMETAVYTPLFRQLARRGRWPENYWGSGFIRILQAGHWPYLRDAAFQILEGTDHYDSVAVLYVDLARIGSARNDAALTSAAEARLRDLCRHPGGVIALLEIAGVLTSEGRAVAALNALAAQTNAFTTLPVDTNLAEPIAMLITALGDPIRMEAADVILEQLRDRLNEGQVAEVEKRRAEKPVVRRRRAHFLDNLRRLVFDPDSVLPNDPDDPAHPDMNQYLRQYLKNAWPKEYGALLQLLLQETDPEVKAKLILKIVEGADDFTTLYKDWEALKFFLSVIENPEVLGRLPAELEEHVRRAAAYAIASSRFDNPFFVETAQIALLLKGTVRTVVAPENVPPLVDESPVPEPGGTKNANLLDRMLDHLLPRDVLEAYLEATDDVVRLQALLRLESVSRVSQLILGRPDALPTLIKDLLHVPARRDHAGRLIGGVNDPPFHRTVLEWIALEEPEVIRDAPDLLYLMAAEIQDESAARKVLARLGQFRGNRPLGSAAAQLVLRLLSSAGGRDAARNVLLQWQLPEAARASIVGALFDQIDLASVHQDGPAQFFYQDLLNSLTKRPDYAESMIGLWKDGLNDRHRVTALHRMVPMNPEFLRGITGIVGALERSQRDLRMAADAAAILQKLAVPKRAEADPQTQRSLLAAGASLLWLLKIRRTHLATKPVQGGSPAVVKPSKDYLLRFAPSNKHEGETYLELLERLENTTLAEAFTILGLPAIRARHEPIRDEERIPHTRASDTKGTPNGTNESNLLDSLKREEGSEIPEYALVVAGLASLRIASCFLLIFPSLSTVSVHVTGSWKSVIGLSLAGMAVFTLIRKLIPLRGETLLAKRLWLYIRGSRSPLTRARLTTALAVFGVLPRTLDSVHEVGHALVNILLGGSASIHFDTPLGNLGLKALVRHLRTDPLLIFFADPVELTPVSADNLNSLGRFLGHQVALGCVAVAGGWLAAFAATGLLIHAVRVYIADRDRASETNLQQIDLSAALRFVVIASLALVALLGEIAYAFWSNGGDWAGTAKVWKVPRSAVEAVFVTGPLTAGLISLLLFYLRHRPAGLARWKHFGRQSIKVPVLLSLTVLIGILTLQAFLGISDYQRSALLVVPEMRVWLSMSIASLFLAVLLLQRAAQSNVKGPLIVAASGFGLMSVGGLILSGRYDFSWLQILSLSGWSGLINSIRFSWESSTIDLLTQYAPIFGLFLGIFLAAQWIVTQYRKSETRSRLGWAAALSTLIVSSAWTPALSLTSVNPDAVGVHLQAQGWQLKFDIDTTRIPYGYSLTLGLQEEPGRMGTEGTIFDGRLVMGDQLHATKTTEGDPWIHGTLASRRFQSTPYVVTVKKFGSGRPITVQRGVLGPELAQHRFQEGLMIYWEGKVDAKRISRLFDVVIPLNRMLPPSQRLSAICLRSSIPGTPDTDVQTAWTEDRQAHLLTGSTMLFQAEDPDRAIYSVFGEAFIWTLLNGPAADDIGRRLMGARISFNDRAVKDVALVESLFDISTYVRGGAREKEANHFRSSFWMPLASQAPTVLRYFPKQFIQRAQVLSPLAQHRAFQIARIIITLLGPQGESLYDQKLLDFLRIQAGTKRSEGGEKHPPEQRRLQDAA